MCLRRFGGKVTAMQSDQPKRIQINLELQLDDGLLSGRASDGDGGVRSFSGWLGLVDAIDALVEGEAPAAAAATSNGLKEKA
jgi:hypothetical protein